MKVQLIDVTTAHPWHRSDCPVAKAERAHFCAMERAGKVERIPYPDGDGGYLSYPPLEMTAKLRASCNCGAYQWGWRKVAVNVEEL